MKYPEIGLHIRTYDDEVKSHSHDHHQLVLPLVGTLFLSVDSMAGEVVQHRAAIILQEAAMGLLQQKIIGFWWLICLRGWLLR